MQILKEQYEKEIVPAIMKKFNYKSVMEVPKLDKIVINIGLGDVKENPKDLENAIKDLEQITGQKPITTKSKKAIAAFKLRAGVTIGCIVTLRQLIFPEIVYEKVDRVRGIDIIFVTTAKTDEEAKELLKLLGMPFKN